MIEYWEDPWPKGRERPAPVQRRLALGAWKDSRRTEKKGKQSMALQFILGNSGSGKSRYAFEQLIQESLQFPEKNFLVVVPEQFTMQTQKTLAQMHPGGGLLNVDVLSFERLAHRVFEEVGRDRRQFLEETGKSLVLQKVVQELDGQLPYLGSRMKKPGYIQEMKSLLSELMQYQVEEEQLEQTLETVQEDSSLLSYKLADVRKLYQGYRAYLRDRYLTGEEVLEVLSETMEESSLVRGSVAVLDGFTGFTPVQDQVIRRMLSLCQRVQVTVTLAAGEDPYRREPGYRLFALSKKTIHSLCQMAEQTRTPILDAIWLKPEGRWRFEQAPALDFLEKNLFRGRKQVFAQEQQEIQLFAAGSPLREMEEVAVRIRKLVRTEGLRYGEIAVITGDLPSYGNYARQAFEKVGIPCFIDEKHSVLMNPFVEYIRAGVEAYIRNFSYESVFRYLRCQMSSLTREEVDELENYVIALGIRGKKRWQETWVRVYQGMESERILEINEMRRRVMEEFEPLLEGWQGRQKTVASMTRALYAFVVKGQMQKKLKQQEILFAREGNLAMEKEYAQIYGIVMELLDKMVAILGEEPMTLLEYQQLLEAGLSQATVGLIPPSADQILVGDMERTRLKDVKVLFFVGMNDGCIPKDTSSGGILSETDRELLGKKGMELSPGPREQIGMQRFYLYLNLTRPSRQLILSYSHGNAEGGLLSPAYLINAVKKLFPSLSVQEAGSQETLERLEHPRSSFSYFLEGLEAVKESGGETEDALWTALYHWYQTDPVYGKAARQLTEAAFYENPRDAITESVAKALYGEISPYSATRLEKFAACAFAHFIQYGLRLRERAVYEFRPMDMGNLMHRALEQFSRELKKRNLNWAELTEEQRESIAEQALETAVEDYGNTILESSARNAYMKKRTERIFKRTLWALQEQLCRGHFVPEGFEVSVGGGRIDRVDVCEADGTVYVKIIDYKTGNTSFHLLELYYGLQMQLVVYLNGAMEAEQKKYQDREVRPAGIFYYNTKDPLLQAKKQKDLEEVEKKLLGNLKMNGLVLDQPEVARLLDATGETIPVRFKKDGTFYAGSSVASREQFALLGEFTRQKIEMLREQILRGEAEAAPYQMKDKNACTFCPYASVCGFDLKIPGYEYRRLRPLEDREIWEAMKKEVE